MRLTYSFFPLPTLYLSLGLGVIGSVISEKCNEPVYTGPQNSSCEGCPVARTAAEIAAVNAEYDSRLYFNEEKRYLCTVDYPDYRDKCYHFWVIERYAIESERAELFAPGSPEREVADARAKIILQEVLQSDHEL